MATVEESAYGPLTTLILRQSQSMGAPLSIIRRPMGTVRPLEEACILV